MSGIIAVQTGLQDEANIIRGTEGLDIFCGSAQRDTLAQLITKDCKGIVSFGVCGGLVPDVSFGQVIIASGVRTKAGYTPANPAWAAEILRRIAGAVPALYYSDPMEEAETVAQRQALAAATGAWVVDEETRAVAEAAALLGIPWAAVRSPSDIWNQSVSPDTNNTTKPDGSPDIGNVIADIIGDPGSLANFLEDAQGFDRALDALRAAFKAAGPTFAYPFAM